MLKKTKSPLARKVEGHKATPDFGSFEAFETRKNKKRKLFIIPFIILLLAAGYFLIYNSENLKSTAPTLTIQTDGSDTQDNTTQNKPNDPASPLPKQENKSSIINNAENEFHNNDRPALDRSFTKAVLIPTDPKKEEVLEKHENQLISILGHKEPKQFAYQAKALDPHVLARSIPLELFSDQQGFSNLSVAKHTFSDLKLNLPKEYFSSITFTSGAHYAKNRLLLADEADRYIHPDFAQILDKVVHSDLGFAAQIVYSKPLVRGLSVYAGLGFTKNRLTGEYKFTIDSFPVYDLDNTIAGFIQIPENSPLRNIDLGTAAQGYSFINIPLGVSYDFQIPKYTFQVSAGTEFSLLTGASGRVLSALNLSEAQELKEIINPKYTSLNTRLSIYRAITSRSDVGLSAAYNLQTNALYDQSQYQIKNSATEIQLILKYKLAKK